MSEQERIPALRLNPFAFVPETNMRFALLMVMTLGIGLNVARNFVPSQVSDVISITALEDPDTGSILETAATKAVVRLWARLGINLALTAGILVVSFWFFRRHPSRIRRRKKLRPVSKDDDPTYIVAIQLLADQAKVSPFPALATSEGSLQTNGQAFGLRKGYVLRLGGRLPLLMRKAPEIFQATVLHELAHIYNGDIGRTYYAQALWAMVLLLVLFPFAVGGALAFILDVGDVLAAAVQGTEANWYELFRFVIPLSLLNAFQISGLGLLFASVRVSVIRVREIYADWRAVQWGAERGLRAILNRHATKKRDWWHRVWGLHPPPQVRVNLLDSPKRLFEMTFDLPLYAGAMFGAAISGLFIFGLGFTATLTTSFSVVVRDVLSPWQASLGDSIVSLIPVVLAILVLIIMVPLAFGLLLSLTAGIMYIVAQALGLQIQRGVIASLAGEGKRGCLPLLQMGLTAAILAVGMQLGFVLTPTSGFAPLSIMVNSEGKLLAALFIPIMLVLWVIGMTIAAWTWMIHTHIMSRRLLGAHTGDQPPRAKGRLLALTQGLLLSILTVPALAAQSWIYREFSGYPVLELIGGLAGLIRILLLYTVLAMASWVAIELWFRLSFRRCPHCGQATRHRTVIRKSCEHCRADLAPWAFSPIRRPPIRDTL